MKLIENIIILFSDRLDDEFENVYSTENSLNKE